MSIQPVPTRHTSRRQTRRDPPLDRGTAVKETAELMAAILDSFPGYLALLDGDGYVFATNCGWTDLHRHGGHESIACAALGENYLEALREAAHQGHEYAQCIREALEELREETGRDRLERTCSSSDGKLLTLVAARLKRPTGGIVVTAVDVTAWATSARALQQAQRDLMKAAQLAVAGELVGGITHDLRQPLTSLQMTLETADHILHQPAANMSMVSGMMSEAIADSQRLRDSVQVLQDLVMRREPRLANVALGSVVAEVVRLLQTEATARHVVIERSVFGEQFEISADATMLRECVLSLLLDAVENCDPGPGAGRVTVGTRAVDDAHIALTVSYQRALQTAGEPGWALSVVRSVAETHGAALSIEETADLLVTVTTTWPTERDKHRLVM